MNEEIWEGNSWRFERAIDGTLSIHRQTNASVSEPPHIQRRRPTENRNGTRFQGIQPRQCKLMDATEYWWSQKNLHISSESNKIEISSLPIHKIYDPDTQRIEMD